MKEQVEANWNLLYVPVQSGLFAPDACKKEEKPFLFNSNGHSLKHKPWMKHLLINETECFYTVWSDALVN